MRDRDPGSRLRRRQNGKHRTAAVVVVVVVVVVAAVVVVVVAAVVPALVGFWVIRVSASLAAEKSGVACH